jgi:adenosylhomocysteinase
MDMSFSNQALVIERLAREPGALPAGVHGVPKDIDDAVARLKLAALGVGIDRLTPEQTHYLASWREGT